MSTLTDQQQKVLEALKGGKWVSNRYLVHTLMISRAPARIDELRAMGYVIKTAPKRDKFGFALYCLEEEAQREFIGFVDGKPLYRGVGLVA